MGIHWIAHTGYSQMSTHVPGFQSFFSGILYHFVLAKLATSSVSLKDHLKNNILLNLDSFINNQKQYTYILSRLAILQ